MSSEFGFRSPDHPILPELEFPEYLLEKELVFKTHTDEEKSRESVVKITNAGEYLGRGGFSDWVRRVDAEVLSKDGTFSPQHTFALKHYVDDSPKDLRSSLNRFNLLKEKGIKTWTTYRINREENLALMTYGNWEDKSLLSPNNADGCELAKRLSAEKLSAIDNLNEIYAEILSEIAKASNERVWLSFDSIAFLVPNSADETKHASIDFIFSDFDMVAEAKISAENLFKQNIQNVFSGFFTFLSQYVEPDECIKYQYELHQKISADYGVDLIDDIGYL